MKKIISTVLASFALVLSGIAASPALAADGTTYVDTFVVPDPSLGSDCMGNGIAFVGIDGVEWTVNGQPYSFTPQGSTLWLPQGGYVNVTATSTDGDELVELNNGSQGGEYRSGQRLTWQHYVSPVDCGASSDCKTTVDTQRVDELTVELSVTRAKVERQRTKINAQRATIKRLRAKLAQR